MDDEGASRQSINMSHREPTSVSGDQSGPIRLRNAVRRVLAATRISLRNLMDWPAKIIDFLGKLLRWPFRVRLERLTVTLIFFGIVLVLMETFREPGVRIDVIRVPQGFVDMGYTPQVVARHLIDGANSFRPETRAPSENRALVNQILRDVDLELPTLGLSFNSAVAFARDLVGRDQYVVTGEILHHRVDNRVSLRLRVDGRQIFDRSTGVGEGGTEQLLAEGAHELMIRIEPLTVAFYHLWRGTRKKAGEVIAFMLENSSNLDEYSRAFFAQGHLHFVNEEYDQALRAYSRAIEFDPEFAASYNGRGATLAEQGKLEAAIEDFQKSIEIDPGHASAYYNWGKALDEHGDTIGAVEQFRRATEADPGFAGAHYNWGFMLDEYGDTAGAIEQYRRAVLADPRFGAAYNNWGTALNRLGDAAGAIEQFRRATEANPGLAFAYYNWGNALDRLGDTAGAIEQFRRAAEIDPGFAGAYYNWGNALDKLGDTAGAIAKFGKAVQANPRFADAHNNWGAVLFRLGDIDGAIEQFRKAVQADPNDETAYYNWGLALHGQGDTPGAIEQFRRAIQADLASAHAYKAWADVLAELGDCDGAAEKYREAKKLDGRLIEPSCQRTAETSRQADQVEASEE